jgi:phospholipid/cholesterol/gamma-HCH transport system substrate-binding protein
MSRQARVGLLVFLGLALFVVALFALANRSFLFSNTFYVKARYNQVAGLQPGASVQFQGVNVGRVETVSLPSEAGGRIVVTMAIRESAQHLVHIDTQAQIKSDGLVGNMIVVLVNPVQVSDSEAIDEGDYIEGIDPFDVFEISDRAVESVQRFAEAATSFEQIMLDVRNGEGTLGKIIYDPALYNSMVATAQETQQLMDNLGRDAEAVVTLAQRATQGVESVLEKVDEGDGTLSLLLNDPGFYNQLLATADTLQGISTDLRAVTKNAENATNWGTLGAYRFAELMEAAKHNWLFKRYFEERGYMEKAPFEVREQAIAESFRQLQEQQRQLARWEDRLQTLEEQLRERAAALDTTVTMSDVAPPDTTGSSPAAVNAASPESTQRDTPSGDDAEQQHP